MKPELVFSDENESNVGLLRQAFEGCPELIALFMKPDELPKYELDAIYLTLMAAERWGPRIINYKYKSQVLKTRSEDKGMPPYIVTGIAMDVDDPHAGDPKSELQLVMPAIFDAVESFNLENNNPIHVIGFWTDMLWINRLDVAEAGKIIRSVYEERYH